MNEFKSYLSLRHGLVMLILSALLTAQWASAHDMPDATQEPPPIATNSTELSADHRASLEPVLRGVLQAAIDKQLRLSGQASIIVVGDVSFNASGDHLTAELSKGYVPTYYGGDFEDHIHDLMNAVFAYMEGVGPIYSVDFTFEGKDILDYFPYERDLVQPAEISGGTLRHGRSDAGSHQELAFIGPGCH